MLTIKARQRHPGHGPGFITAALCEAIEERRVKDWPDALKIEFFRQEEQEKWDRATAEDRAVWVVGHLFACGDIVPGSLYTEVSEELDFHGRHTFGALARVLARDLKRRLAAEAPPLLQKTPRRQFVI